MTQSASPAATAPLSAAERPEPGSGLGSLVVLLLMVAIVGGGLVAQEAVAGAPPVPIEVRAGVTVTPPAEWEFGGRSEDGNTIVLSRGSGSLAVTVPDGTDARTALESLRDEWLASGTVTAAEITEVSDARPGSTGYRFAYSGTFYDMPAAVEGEVTAFGGTEVVVLFDGWSGFGQYLSVSNEIDSIIAGAVIP